MNMILETPRLYLRKMQQDDQQELCTFLQDIEVMYAWEAAFSEQEVTNWLNENLMRYQRDGYSYWAVIEKATGKLVGVTGLIAEQVEQEQHLGIGYIYKKSAWGNGYATEAASACIDHAFHILNAAEVTAQIRPENIASRKVAEKLGMSVKAEFVKYYQGKAMPHLLYHCTKPAQP